MSERDNQINYRQLQPPNLKGDAGEGLRAGRTAALRRYGVGDWQIGPGVSNIFKRRMDRLDKKSAAQSEIRENVNRQADMARARGASAAQIHAIQRAGTRDLGRDLDATERRNLGDAQSLLGNIIRGKTAIEGAYGSLAAGQGVNTSPPSLNTGFLGLKVICTELHRQGLIDDEILSREEELGVWMSDNMAWAYYGYQFLGSMVVMAMRKSPALSKVVHKLFLHFYDFMFEGKKNPIGAMILLIGFPLCVLFYFPFGIIYRKKIDDSVKFMKSFCSGKYI